uniref:uncharacterized protein LOC120329081 n=1 Tax=Styela clava TaxID=7725 RepID=UPI001939DA9B|nr:uncharacterized protein LOC120329081 [Styela clava]
MSSKMEEHRHYFMYGSKLKFDEDSTLEFKGHRLISHADISNPKSFNKKQTNQTKLPRTRQAVSRCLCAFLNTGSGGDVYLGVNDEGRVIALKLSLRQMDHLLLQIVQVFDSFNPPVPNYMWWLAFIPVVTSRSEVHERLDLIQEWRSLKYDDVKRSVAHRFPSHGLCWCDVTQHTEMSHQYVVRIHLKSSKMKKSENNRLCLPTIYQCDNGKAYFRNCASVLGHTPQQVVRHTRDCIEYHYQPIVDKLKEELKALLR